MSMDARLQKLEAASAPPEHVIIRVVCVPPDVPADEQNGYWRLHPECVERTIEMTDGVITSDTGPTT